VTSREQSYVAKPWINPGYIVFSKGTRTRTATKIIIVLTTKLKPKNPSLAISIQYGESCQGR